MILQFCRNGLPFSSLDHFRSIILVVAGMFLLKKYKPDQLFYLLFSFLHRQGPVADLANTLMS